MEKIKMTPELLEAITESDKIFREKFGRERGPNDPILFDPDEDEPTKLTESKLMRMMTHSFLEAGSPPHLIFAWVKSGLMLSTETYKTCSSDKRRDWDRAIAEFEFLEATGVVFNEDFFERLMDQVDRQKAKAANPTS